jgi:hypothetical protein
VTENENGFPEDVSYEWLGGIPANFTDTTREDEVLANQLGYSADQNVEIMKCNYSGQSFFVDEATGDEYDIKRSYEKDKSGRIVLTAQLRERGKESGTYII